jgi:dipeptidyl aminopeptidase/acylaminoacyl peptidase
MKRTLAVALASLLFVFARSPQDRTITDPVSIVSPKNPAAKPVPLDDLFVTRSMTGGSWSADGSEITFTTNLTGRLNVWKVASDGGWPVQMAASDDRQVRPIFSPDGAWIIWQQDRGGNEAWDLWAVPSSGGAAVNLTGTPDVAESGAVFSHDSKQLAFSHKPTAAAATNLAVMDVATHAVRKLTNEASPDRNWNVVEWSRDGKWLFANRTNSDDTIGEIYRIDVASGRAENLTPPPPPAAKVLITASSLSPDDRTLLVTSNEQGGHANVALLDTTTKKLTWLTSLEWEADGGDFSPDGAEVTYSVNEDGRTDLYAAAVVGGASRKLALPEGTNGLPGAPSSFSPKGDRLLVTHQNSTTPNDFWILDRKSGKTTQLSRSALASLDPTALPQSQIVHYKSFDGTMISALLFVPFNLERNGHNPGIVYPHGGPTGQTIDTFNRTIAALVTRGYTVIAPNVRGSTGYGLPFQRLNYQDLGGGDLQDEVYGAKFLGATGYIDPKKIGITGGSYGGFMTLMAIGKTPDVWAAAVSLYGIVDWYTMLQHEDPRLQEYEKSLLGDPVKDKAVYEATSPIKYLGNAKAPLLLLQGDNDIRVPKEEAEQVASILKTAGKTVDAHYYPNEGHGFAKRENQIDSARRTIEWFDKYLK